MRCGVAGRLRDAESQGVRRHRPLSYLNTHEDQRFVLHQSVVIELWLGPFSGLVGMPMSIRESRVDSTHPFATSDHRSQFAECDSSIRCSSAAFNTPSCSAFKSSIKNQQIPPIVDMNLHIFRLSRSPLTPTLTPILSPTRRNVMTDHTGGDKVGGEGALIAASSQLRELLPKREQLRLRANVDRRCVDGGSRRDAFLQIVLIHQFEVVTGLHHRHDPLFGDQVEVIVRDDW